MLILIGIASYRDHRANRILDTRNPTNGTIQQGPTYGATSTIVPNSTYFAEINDRQTAWAVIVN